MRKRIWAYLLTLVMVVGLLPTVALAEEGGAGTGTAMSGYCGADTSYDSSTYTFIDGNNNSHTETYYSNVVWTLTENGTVTVDNSTKTAYKLSMTGSGPMGDFFASWSYGKPWLDAIASSTNEPLTSCRNYITEIYIDDGITRIGDRVFNALSNVTMVSMPNSITEVGDWAFQACGNITSITFSNSLETLGEQAFAECKSLTSVALPNSLETIGKMAFYLCSGLSGSLTIPNNVKVIGNSAFTKCTGLNGTLTLGSKVEEIGDGAFLDTAFTGVLQLPESVKTIQKNPFGTTTGTITNSFKIYLNNSLQTIGEAAFQEMTMDEILVIPQSVTSIAKKAFYNAKEAKVIRFAGGSPTINDQAFYGMKSVHSLDVTALPESTAYGNQTFSEWGTYEQNGYSIIVYVKNETQKTNVSSAIDSAQYRNSFAVTNGGTFANGTTFTANTLATPTKEGYTFGGWYSNSGCTTEATDITAGNTYYAKWALNKPVITVVGDVNKTYDGQDVTLSVPEVADATYTWKKDGKEVSGANSRTLALKNFADSGSYTCTITAGGASETSDAVAVSITKANPELTLSANSGSCRINRGPATFTYTYDGDGTVSASSSNEAVATATASNGTVTVELKSVGTAAITVSAAESANYNAATAAYDLTVQKKKSSSSSSNSGSSSVKPAEKPEEKPAEPDVKPEEKPAEPVVPTNPAEVPAAEKIVLTVGQRVANAFGEPVVNDVAPIIRDDRTMLPIRFIAEGLGATVAWDGTLQKVSIAKGDNVIDIYIGSLVAFVNGSPVELDSPAFIENGRTYLPLRFVAENLGATVFWNAETQEVTIVPNK